ncbi:ThiF family adenylyltransferase [Streptomyces polyrhachis]|uniref:ThiF family adenylyltransferase n=1 Tax=Streptomyces polyrhachis TaxID=1282885 RepID=A0ABW2GGC6_9ACTN
MLRPALRRAWRSGQTVQFGVTRATAVTFGPLDPDTGILLDRLTGARGLSLVRQEAAALGLREGAADQLLSALAGAGLLMDATGGGPGAARLRERAGALDRLRPDLASLSVLHPDACGGLERLAARRALQVQVRGAGRVGAAVAALLSAAGVGRVEVRDGGCVEPWDVGPGGHAPQQVGERREVSARRAVRAAAPEPPGAGRPAGERATAAAGPALVVLAPRDGFAAYAPDPDAAAELMAAGVPHLYAGVLEATGVVGPLVLPGGTACAGCLAAARAAEEPEWPRLLAQWRSGGRRQGVQSCDVALAALVAGLTASHVLTYLDGGLPPVTGARLELALPGLDPEVGRLEPFPGCGCGAVGTALPARVPAAVSTTAGSVGAGQEAGGARV